MSTKTGISWTDATWNPIRGCSRVSEGCRHCYAERVAYRFSGEGQPYEGLVRIGMLGERRPEWNGKIKFVEEHLLDPLRWKKPRRIFVNSMSDLFHENVTDEIRDKIYAVMALCPQHTFQVLTKRPERMLGYLKGEAWALRVDEAVYSEIHDHRHNWTDAVLDRALGRANTASANLKRSVAGIRVDGSAISASLSNVQLGVSVEDRNTADLRIPLLLQTPAAVRFISAEPLLGLVDIRPYLDAEFVVNARDCEPMTEYTAKLLQKMATAAYRQHGGVLLDWVIVGGESGPGARPMHPDWARNLRDQCKAAGVPFFFKQWGAWGPCENGEVTPHPQDRDGAVGHIFADDSKPRCAWEEVWNVGARAAGCLLDGVEHHEFPTVRA